MSLTSLSFQNQFLFQLVQRNLKEVWDQVGIGPHDLIGVIEVGHHASPFFFTVVFNNRLLFFLCLKVHAHTDGVSFGMELRTHHVWIEADAHKCLLIGNMRPVFFNAKDLCPHTVQGFKCRSGYLVVATVNNIERIFQSGENRILLPLQCNMNGEYTKGRRFFFTQVGDALMPAY